MSKPLSRLIKEIERHSPTLKNFDFRSDTGTIPTAGMLAQMVCSVTGDDVWLEDPTISKLENKIAAICGKEAGLFVPTGTMSNQLALRTHVTNNLNHLDCVYQSIICDHRSHVYKYENGGGAFHSGAQMAPVVRKHGDFLTCDVIEKLLHLDSNWHTPVTSIVCLENTINGTIYPLEEMKRVRELCTKNNLSLHLDGARLWNASIATGVSLQEYGELFDSISLCMSKGLGAPVGSVLVGSQQFIYRARQYRKGFGGGMRQAGVLAGACLYAFENNWKTMAHVHDNTKNVARKLRDIGFECDEPETNMIFANSTKLGVSWNDIAKMVEQIQEDREHKVLLDPQGHDCRLVLHFQTPEDSCELLLELIKEALQKISQKKAKL